ncbi:FAD-dependent oxidoreductase [Romeria aff. gracilis LEGE 07310]|uniref:malate dehydrogenase (quinone) n=1 Tax=Vasconcelosia minhoensis LEGE 07310 TaxID=915328 RepID=A0A8J7AU80_9CYAN|nr:FAD-dependent oxidoreductase [Romeria gracilis]MBE9076743.1 FAD-dependent oxidoreductase [Romeria aff. gracilis LEGE 07310]
MTSDSSHPSAPYDVVIVGAGICGTALLYSLSRYTNVQKIALLEKYEAPALVNSHVTGNSQTLHFGDIETNYTLDKAKKVSRAANLVKHYLLQADPQHQIYTKYHKLVLAVGSEQVSHLQERYQTFKSLFPQLRLLDRAEIDRLEPSLLAGRDSDEAVTALFTEEGYTVDYQQLADSFLEKSLQDSAAEKEIDAKFGVNVRQIRRVDGLYQVQTEQATFVAKTVAVMAGAHSLLLAKSLGYGQDYALLSVAGSFYFAPAKLNGKVYTMQMKKLPFAAIHGDPEVHDASQTRFGPTAKVLPMLERHRYSSILPYFKTAGLSLAAFQSFFNILSDWDILKYILRNFIYDIPVVGKRLFIQEARKIVPSLKLSELSYARGYGGIRPQIVNLKTRQLELGEAKIVGDDILFGITPSPGASTCLKNAEEDTARIISFLGGDYRFDRDRFLADLGCESLV